MLSGVTRRVVGVVPLSEADLLVRQGRRHAASRPACPRGAQHQHTRLPLPHTATLQTDICTRHFSVINVFYNTFMTDY